MSEDIILVTVERRLARLTSKFLAHCSRSVGELRVAVDSGDIAAARRIGHSLSGTAGSYRFEAVAAIGVAIEDAIDAGDAAALGALTSQLERYLARVQLVFEDAGAR